MPTTRKRRPTTPRIITFMGEVVTVPETVKNVAHVIEWLKGEARKRYLTTFVASNTETGMPLDTRKAFKAAIAKRTPITIEPYARSCGPAHS